jgi:hypothetical protein
MPSNVVSDPPLVLSTYQLDGITLRTGDIICTTDGQEGALFGLAYRLLGMLVPGPIDHLALYVGPGPRCVEAGVRGPIIYNLAGHRWHAARMVTRRLLLDRLYGVADPTAERGLSEEQARRIRLGAAEYCLRQAHAGRPYNVNFFNPYTERAFYCSQLIYLAYLQNGIHLRDSARLPQHPWLGSVIFPMAIWNACRQQQVVSRGSYSAT